MAWTQADVDALKAAIASGAQSVTYPDGSAVTYRSLGQMKDVLGMMQAEVNRAAGGQKRIRRILLNTSKGV